MAAEQRDGQTAWQDIRDILARDSRTANAAALLERISDNGYEIVEREIEPTMRVSAAFVVADPEMAAKYENLRDNIGGFDLPEDLQAFEFQLPEKEAAKLLQLPEEEQMNVGGLEVFRQGDQLVAQLDQGIPGYQLTLNVDPELKTLGGRQLFVQTQDADGEELRIPITDIYQDRRALTSTPRNMTILTWLAAAPNRTELHPYSDRPSVLEGDAKVLLLRAVETVQSSLVEPLQLAIADDYDSLTSVQIYWLKQIVEEFEIFFDMAGELDFTNHEFGNEFRNILVSLMERTVDEASLGDEPAYNLALHALEEVTGDGALPQVLDTAFNSTLDVPVRLLQFYRDLREDDTIGLEELKVFIKGIMLQLGYAPAGAIGLDGVQLQPQHFMLNDEELEVVRAIWRGGARERVQQVMNEYQPGVTSTYDEKLIAGTVRNAQAYMLDKLMAAIVRAGGSPVCETMPQANDGGFGAGVRCPVITSSVYVDNLTQDMQVTLEEQRDGERLDLITTGGRSKFIFLKLQGGAAHSFMIGYNLMRLIEQFYENKGPQRINKMGYED